MNKKSMILCFMVLIPLQAQGMGFARALLGKGHALVTETFSSLGVSQRLSSAMPRLVVFGSLGGCGAFIGSNFYAKKCTLSESKTVGVAPFPSMVEWEKPALDKAKKDGNVEQQISLLLALSENCQTQADKRYVVNTIESLTHNRPSRWMSYFMTPQQRDKERALERLTAHKELLMKELSAIQS